MNSQAEEIAQELGGVLRTYRIEGDEIIVLLEDGRKVHRLLEAVKKAHIVTAPAPLAESTPPPDNAAQDAAKPKKKGAKSSG